MRAWGEVAKSDVNTKCLSSPCEGPIQEKNYFLCFRQCPGAPRKDFSVNGCFTVVDPGGPRGHDHFGPVKISHKKDGQRR